MNWLNTTKLKTIFKAARPNQWIKNMILFTSIIFSGKLFDLDLLWKTIFAFVVFCLLSSTSYILNDIIDYPFDKKHPQKQKRPIASGELSIQDATFIVFLLSLVALVVSVSFSIPFFLISLIFLLLHFFYSLYSKKYPVFDIFTIAFSFMLRAFAGQVATGYHIQIWLLLTIFFMSLFIATVKRDAELALHGAETRASMSTYKEHLLNFLTTTFATTTIISYSLYTFLETPPLIPGLLSQIYPQIEGRKWFMVTIPLVVYGIARYAQLLYEKAEGETPEKIITKDMPLVATILLWGMIVVSLIYIF